MPHSARAGTVAGPHRRGAGTIASEEVLPKVWFANDHRKGAKLGRARPISARHDI